jgi:hypothetical protein
VLLCLDEKTGALVWQLVVPKRDEDPYMDWPRMGISSEATVESNRVYVVDNRGAALCLDVNGMSNGNDGPFMDEAAYLTPSGLGPSRAQAGAETHPQPLRPPPDRKLEQPGSRDADIIWKFDLVADAGIWPHDAAHSSILIHGNHLYLNTGNGVDNTHRKIRSPQAPSLVVLDKHTGQWLARDNEQIAPNVFHNTWASPSMGTVNGRQLIFFCGGNGIVYAFEPLKSDPRPGENPRTLKKVWQFDFDPPAAKTDVHRFTGNRQQGPSDFYGMPVFSNTRLYVAGGGDLWWGKNEAWLKCIDASKTGNITTNGLVWSCPLEKHVLATPAVDRGLVYIVDCGRTFHCVEAATGRSLWTDEIDGEVWASPLVADGKVFIGTRSGGFYVFAAAREKKLLAEVDFSSPISATATAANGVLFVATMNELFAISKQHTQKGSASQFGN